jgi:hypothetical protein
MERQLIPAGPVEEVHFRILLPRLFLSQELVVLQ